MSTQKTIEEILSAAVVASPPIVTQPPTDLETRTDDLQLRTADALAEVEELLSIREPLPTDLWREFTGSEAASEAWRYYESVTERYIAFYHAGDGVGVVTGQKVDYSIQDDFGLMMGDRSAALSAALASIKAEL